MTEKFGENIPGQEWVRSYLNTSTVIDILLIQRWALIILNYQIRNIQGNEKSLNEMKRKILLGIEEYHSIILSYGSAQDIVKQGKIKMGINELYDSLLQKLNNMEHLIHVEETRRLTQRDLLLKSGTAFAAIMFGLVGAWGTVKIISDWAEYLPSVPSFWRIFLEPVVQLARSHSIAVALSLYFISLITILIFFAWSFWPSQRNKPIISADQSRPAYKPGFKWDKHINIVERDNEDDSNN